MHTPDPSPRAGDASQFEAASLAASHPAVTVASTDRLRLVVAATRRGVSNIRVLVDTTEALVGADGGPAEWVEPPGGSAVELVVDFDLETHPGIDLFTFAAEAEELLGVAVRVGTSTSAGHPELVEVPL